MRGGDLGGATSETHAFGRTRGIRRIDLASAEPASSEGARDINRDIVLELIRFKQPLARIDLSRLSGLQPSTISAIVDQLMDEGWITEGAVVRGARGRPLTMLSLNEGIVTLALDLRPDRAILAVIDLSGRFLSRETVMIAADPVKAMSRIVERMLVLRDAHPDRSFEGIGVSVPGRVHPVTQRLILAPNLKWDSFDIKAVLEDGLGLQVEVDNDANACLLSELWYGRLGGVRNAVLVAISEGVGTSILAGGQLIAGYNGLAGEFGHIPIDHNGPVCGCGRRGCWEVFASSRAALRYHAEIDPRAGVNDIYQLLRLAEGDDSGAVEALTRQAKAVGAGLQLITTALSPEVILITGEITSAWQRLGPIVEEALERDLLAGTPPRLVAAGDGDAARLSGGAAMLLQRHTSYHHSTHATKTARQKAANGSAAGV